MGDWRASGKASDVFDRLRVNRATADACAVRELALIAQACDEWTVDTSRADAAAERLVRGGADGTAEVGEFLALELAGLLQITTASAAIRISQTLDLRDRHPELWAHVQSQAIKPWQALKVAARCSEAGLSADAARWVDHQLALGVGVLPWPRVARALEGLIVKADAELAAERARQVRERRHVFVGDHRDGASILFAKLDTEDALALDRTISDLSNALAAAGSAEPVDQRRATALGVLADPQAALELLRGHGDGRPTNRAATLVVHLAAEALIGGASPTDARRGGARGVLPVSEARREAPVPDARGAVAVSEVRCAIRTPVAVDGAGVARVEGVGPLDTDTLRRFLADSRVVVRPVIDLDDVPAVDSYEIPERLRQHVLARHPVEVFPFSGRPAEGLDLDHTVPYDPLAPPGARQTRADNLGPLTRRVHRAKTARLWRVEQPSPGEFLWTSAKGFRYRVTPHGTVALGRAVPQHPR